MTDRQRLQDPVGWVMSKKITDPGVQEVIDRAFRDKAPLTCALIKVGLVTRVSAITKTVLEVEVLDPDGPPTAVNGPSCPAYNIRAVPLPFTHCDLGRSQAGMDMSGCMSHAPWERVTDITNLEALKETAEKVAEKVEEQVRSVFANCRVVVGLEPGLFDLKEGGGIKIMTVINAYTAGAEAKYKYGPKS